MIADTSLSLSHRTLANFVELLISHADFNYCYYHIHLKPHAVLMQSKPLMHLYVYIGIGKYNIQMYLYILYSAAVLEGYEVISAMRKSESFQWRRYILHNMHIIYARSIELKSLPNVVRPFFLINHSLSLDMLKYVSRKKYYTQRIRHNIPTIQ